MYFYDEFRGDWNIHCPDDLVICLGDFSGHVGRHIDVVHGGYGVGQRNFEGRILLVLLGERIMCVNHMV